MNAQDLIGRLHQVNPYSLDRESMLYNLRVITEFATPEQIDEGLDWYAEAAQICIRLAVKHNLPVLGIVGTMAICSQSAQWPITLQSTKRLVRAFALGQDIYSVKAFASDKQRAKILNCLLSGTFEYAKGPKIQPFACGIASALGQKKVPVTVDRHAYNAAHGLRLIVDRRGPGVNDARRAAVSWAYEQLAQERGWTYHQAQAVVWVVWLTVYKDLEDVSRGWVARFRAEKATYKGVNDD